VSLKLVYCDIKDRWFVETNEKRKFYSNHFVFDLDDDDSLKKCFEIVRDDFDGNKCSGFIIEEVCNKTINAIVNKVIKLELDWTIRKITQRKKRDKDKIKTWEKKNGKRNL
jgi:hypothetical protein